jgi:hypothetical protein
MPKKSPHTDTRIEDLPTKSINQPKIHVFIFGGYTVFAIPFVDVAHVQFLREVRVQFRTRKHCPGAKALYLIEFFLLLSLFKEKKEKK